MGEQVPQKSSSFLSFTDAAEAVLEQFGHKQPMHYRAITEKVLALGLVNTKGLTPEATLYAQKAGQAGGWLPDDTALAVKEGRGALTWQGRAGLRRAPECCSVAVLIEGVAARWSLLGTRRVGSICLNWIFHSKNVAKSTLTTERAACSGFDKYSDIVI